MILNECPWQDWCYHDNRQSPFFNVITKVFSSAEKRLIIDLCLVWQFYDPMRLKRVVCSNWKQSSRCIRETQKMSNFRRHNSWRDYISSHRPIDRHVKVLSIVESFSGIAAEPCHRTGSSAALSPKTVAKAVINMRAFRGFSFFLSQLVPPYGWSTCFQSHQLESLCIPRRPSTFARWI